MSASTPIPAGDLPPAGDSIGERIRAAQAGSGEALGQLLDASRKYLLMSANRALDAELRCKVGASDLVQETFTHAHIGFGSFQSTTEAELFAWLLAILDHRLANVARHYRGAQKRDMSREQPLELGGDLVDKLRDGRPTPGAAAMAGEEVRRVARALEQLPPSYREVLIERNWQMASFNEIGSKRGCSADAARKLWSRALGRLEEVLGDTV